MTHDVRHGDWIRTYTGRAFWPLDPKPEDVHLMDICHALSMEPRYGGHADFHYSVAQHCVLLHDYLKGIGAPLHWLRFALLHDASEAYLKDIPRPLKAFLPEYHAIEERVTEVIEAKFGIFLTAEDRRVFKELDSRITVDEQAAMFSASLPLPSAIAHLKPLGVQIYRRPPESIRNDFYIRLQFYYGEFFA